MNPWVAAHLPKIRDSLYRILTDPDSALRRGLLSTAGEAAAAVPVDHLARSLAVADLYWVTPGMAALAVGSARTLPGVRWSHEDRPSTYGLLVFDGGVGTIDHQDVPVPVDAVSWGPHPAGLLIGMYLRRSRIADRLAAVGARVDPAVVPPLIPCATQMVDAGDGWRQPVDLPDVSRTVLTTLAAAWSLMQQPTIVDRARVEVDRKVRAAYRRAGRGDPDVTLVALRRQYRPSNQPPLDPDQPGRHYRHRWIVQGHWRQQAYGPELTLRRQTWIPAYLKGPEGAALLETTKVNVWRR